MMCLCSSFYLLFCISSTRSLPLQQLALKSSQDALLIKKCTESLNCYNLSFGQIAENAPIEKGRKLFLHPKTLKRTTVDLYYQDSSLVHLDWTKEDTKERKGIHSFDMSPKS